MGSCQWGLLYVEMERRCILSLTCDIMADSCRISVCLIYNACATGFGVGGYPPRQAKIEESVPL